MVGYFDSAYIAKLYLFEPDSEPVRRFASGLKAITCCQHGRVEVAYVFHRKLREGVIDKRGLQVRMDQLRSDTLSGFLRWLPVSSNIVDTASEKVRELEPGVWIRAADALHLVSARDNGFDTVFSNDRHLLAAASHYGVSAREIE